jgi:hypothetical protein
MHLTAWMRQRENCLRALAEGRGRDAADKLFPRQNRCHSWTPAETLVHISPSPQLNTTRRFRLIAGRLDIPYPSD